MGSGGVGCLRGENIRVVHSTLPTSSLAKLVAFHKKKMEREREAERENGGGTPADAKATTGRVWKEQR